MFASIAPRILWIDSLGALAVGVPMLLLAPTLAEWYGLPFPVLLAVAAANVCYGSASFTLALTPRWRTTSTVRALATANMLWGVVCAALFVRHAGDAGLLGLGHFALEGAYVASLGVVEWRLTPAIVATRRDAGAQWHLLECRVPPPVVALGAAAAMTAIAFDWSRGPVAPMPRVGLALAIVGLLLALWAIVAFRRASTTIHPLHPAKASTLVIAGPNRWTRNPMYLGLLLVLTGWGIALGSALALLLVPLVWAWLSRFQVRPEERALDARFGDSYRRYAAAVRRWV